MERTTYEERIYSHWNILLLGVVVLALLGVLVYQMAVGPLGTRPASNWFLVGMIFFFLALGINFATLTIRVTTQGVSAAYGAIRYSIPWSNIAGCRLDEASAIRYGGWGIRLGWAGGKKRLVYNIIGSQRVVVEKKQGFHQEFVFSTRKPNEVLKAINDGLGGRF